MSRPEKPIDWKRVDELLLAGCHGTEIASHFDMHCQTFYVKVEQTHNMSFTAYSLEKKQKGDSLLREKQFQKALDKDNTMLIWLGKNRLGQKEDPSQEFEKSNKLVQTLLDEIMQMKRDMLEAKKSVNEN